MSVSGCIPTLERGNDMFSVVRVWGRAYHTETDEVEAGNRVAPEADRSASVIRNVAPGAAAQQAPFADLIGICMLSLVIFV